ncbi:Hypothetical protein FKW44_003018 [Caligus rogercresseyi]|uniref:Uncharacterized protein n=1 Tax=Caligus rogercresseyi TaxID=217165 RepID=A0A7T8KLD2_CALRO|nr:Hypothetical protein FKW44_003018 [Caligus rogercresseyi]
MMIQVDERGKSRIASIPESPNTQQSPHGEEILPMIKYTLRIKRPTRGADLSLSLVCLSLFLLLSLS